MLGMTVAAASLALAPGHAKAEWPERPITVVVMYNAGGGTDTNLRALSHEMSKATGWRINVINKGAGGGAAATNFVLNKPADGYTWLGAANYNRYIRVMGRVDSKAWVDWQYMTAAVSLGDFSVRSDSPFKTFDDFVAAAKKNPGQITVSTSGVGNLWHELGAIVCDAAGIKVRFVPYQGGKPAALAGLNGEVDVAAGGVHEHFQYVRAGQMRSLMQTSAHDITLPGGKVMPSVLHYLPNLKGHLPGGIYNLGLRRNTPVDIMKKIQAAFVKAVDSPGYQKVLKTKYFQKHLALGEQADMEAAYAETVTATTFQNLEIKGAIPPEKLGLPTPANFDKWWPPKGYKPAM
jgi:tripartite-type tricarboxylate transporter receptor subunit TctC